MLPVPAASGAIGDPGLRLRQLDPVARQVAKVLNLGGRHKAAPEQSMLQQFRNPLTILGICFASRNRLDVMRIHQHQLELAFQSGPYRAPINSGCLHHYVGDFVLLQPIANSLPTNSSGATIDLRVARARSDTDKNGFCRRSRRATHWKKRAGAYFWRARHSVLLPAAWCESIARPDVFRGRESDGPNACGRCQQPFLAARKWEPILVPLAERSGYEGMLQRKSTIPFEDRPRIRQVEWIEKLNKVDGP